MSILIVFGEGDPPEVPISLDQEVLNIRRRERFARNAVAMRPSRYRGNCRGVLELRRVGYVCVEDSRRRKPLREG